MLKGAIPSLEQQLENVTVNTIRVDTNKSDSNGFTILLGTDKGLKSFTVNYADNSI